MVEKKFETKNWFHSISNFYASLNVNGQMVVSFLDSIKYLNSINKS